MAAEGACAAWIGAFAPLARQGTSSLWRGSRKSIYLFGVVAAALRWHVGARHCERSVAIQPQDLKQGQSRLYNLKK